AQSVQLGAIQRLLIARRAAASPTTAAATAATSRGCCRCRHRIQFVVHILQVGMLQRTTIRIDLYRRSVQLFPDTFTNGRQEIDGAIGGRSIDGFLFDEAGEALAVE